MNEKNRPISGYATQIVSSHRRFSNEFKRDAVRLIVDEQYTFKTAARAVGVRENSLRVWHKKFAPPLATELVSDALRKAIVERRPDGKELLHHSDRGCQYTSNAYQKTLRTLGIECSMSRTGDCYDNAAMERFFWSLKHEWTKHESYDNLQEARLGVFKYIETFYNPVRIHQTLGYLSPNQYEAEHAPAVAA